MQEIQGCDVSTTASSDFPVTIPRNSFSVNEPSGNTRRAYFKSVSMQNACTWFRLRACMDFGVRQLCQGQLFLSFPSRASGKFLSSLSKCACLQGKAIDCHCFLPLINPPQQQYTQSETSIAGNSVCLISVQAAWDLCAALMLNIIKYQHAFVKHHYRHL